MERVWSLVMDRGDVSLTPKALLALGAMAKRVRPSHPDLATQIVTDLHHLLEEHTGIAVLEKTFMNTLPISQQTILYLTLCISTNDLQLAFSLLLSLTLPCTLYCLIASLMQGQKSHSPHFNSTPHSVLSLCSMQL